MMVIVEGVVVAVVDEFRLVAVVNFIVVVAVAAVAYAIGIVIFRWC